MSNMLYASSVLYKSSLPMVIVFNKVVLQLLLELKMTVSMTCLLLYLYCLDWYLSMQLRFRVDAGLRVLSGTMNRTLMQWMDHITAWNSGSSWSFAEWYLECIGGGEQRRLHELPQQVSLVSHGWVLRVLQSTCLAATLLRTSTIANTHLSTNGTYLPDSTIKATGVSAATGEGVEGLFTHIDDAAVEFKELYLPDLLR